LKLQFNCAIVWVRLILVAHRHPEPWKKVIMMPTIRISDALYVRIQRLAVPLVDTAASVIERHLPPDNTPEVVEPDVEVPAGTTHETYENTANKHVTVHRAGCAQLRKMGKGGKHKYHNGKYVAHTSLADAVVYATTRAAALNGKLIHCSFCKPV
jgi:hypothetical protein